MSGKAMAIMTRDSATIWRRRGNGGSNGEKRQRRHAVGRRRAVAASGVKKLIAKGRNTLWQQLKAKEEEHQSVNISGKKKGVSGK